MAEEQTTQVQEPDLATQIQNARGKFDDDSLLTHLVNNGYIDGDAVTQAKSQNLTSKDILDHLGGGNNPVIMPSQVGETPKPIVPNTPATVTAQPKPNPNSPAFEASVRLGAPIIAATLTGILGPEVGLSSKAAAFLSSASMPLAENILRAKYSNDPEDADLANPITSAKKVFKDTAFNELFGKAIDMTASAGSGIGNLVNKALKNKLDTEESKLGLTVGQTTGSKMAQWLEDVLASDAKEGQMSQQQVNAKNMIEEQMTKIAGRPVKLDDYYTLAGDVRDQLNSQLPKRFRTSDNFVDNMRDITSSNDKLNDFLSSQKTNLIGSKPVNPKKEIAAFKFADMWENATTKNPDGSFAFNPKKFIDQFRDADFSQTENPAKSASVKDILFSPGTQQSIERFVNAFGKAQGKPGISRYLAMRGLFDGIGLSSGIATHLLLGTSPGVSAMVSAAGLGGATIGLHEVGKLLADPQTARILTAMAEGGALGTSDRIAARILARGMYGKPLDFNLNDGSKISGTMTPKGFKMNNAPGTEIKIKGQ